MIDAYSFLGELCNVDIIEPEDTCVAVETDGDGLVGETFGNGILKGELRPVEGPHGERLGGVVGFIVFEASDTDAGCHPAVSIRFDVLTFNPAGDAPAGACLENQWIEILAGEPKVT